MDTSINPLCSPLQKERTFAILYTKGVVVMSFDYSLEKSEDILCLDAKSFYASVECVSRNLHPLDTMLVVMSNAENAGGLVLAASPKAKKVLGISNVSRKYDIPPCSTLMVVPPRMKYYIEKNTEINNIYRKYVSDEDLYIYSIDESFLSIRPSLELFNKDSAYNLARMIQFHVFRQTGIYVTIGIGDNMLLSKLALDNEAKRNADFIAEWRYQNVPQTIWKIENLTDMWGIGSRTEKRLHRLGIFSVYDLAHANFYELRQAFGVMGEQLYANAWGIDRSNIRQRYQPREKSYGNSQVLPRDYTKRQEIEIVIREIAQQVAARIRRHQCQTGCVSLYIGYSKHEEERGFSRQMKIPVTSNSKKLVAYVLELFDKHYRGQAVRNIGISYSKLTYHNGLQMNLFEKPEEQIAAQRLDLMTDRIREKYGFRSLVHASSLLEGATAIRRTSLVGGHAGGMDGIQ